MAHLHEILAVEGDLDATLKKIYDEAISTFDKRMDHYSGAVRRLEMFDESRKHEEVTEHKELVDTVRSKLDYVAGHAIRYLDANAQKEWTNQTAVADLVFRGKVLIEKAPATWLLALESKLKALRAVLEKAPTLQPGVSWVPAPDVGPNVYKTEHEQIAMKTEKSLKVVTLTKATDKHPETVEKLNVDVPVGRYVSSGVSGMMTPAAKSKMLGNVDDLIQAAKQARQRANTSPVVRVEVGATLFNAVFDGV